MAQLVEHILGKDEVISSNLISSSRKTPACHKPEFFFWEKAFIADGLLVRAHFGYPCKAGFCPSGTDPLVRCSAWSIALKGGLVFFRVLCYTV